jgi:hypothetical protein
MAEDKSIKCAECGAEFVFTAAEQETYEQRGYSEPKRCKPCREQRRAARPRRGSRNPHK